MAGSICELQRIVTNSAAATCSFAASSLKADSASLRFYQRAKPALVATQKSIRRRVSIGQAVRFEDDGYSSFYEPVRCGKKDKCKSKAKSKEAVIARATFLENEVAEIVCEGGSAEAETSSLSQEKLIQQVLVELKALRADVKALKTMAMKDTSSSSSSSSSSSEDDMPPNMMGKRGPKQMRGNKCGGKGKVATAASSTTSAFTAGMEAAACEGPAVNVAGVTAPGVTISSVVVPAPTAAPMSAAMSAFVPPAAPAFPASPFAMLPNNEGVYEVEDIVAAIASSAAAVAVPSILQLPKLHQSLSAGSATTTLQQQRSALEAVIQKESAAAVGTEVSCNGALQVCMGGKCKKSGGGEILSALEQAARGTGLLVEARSKCMGKCKMAPNVKVWRDGESMMESYVTAGEAQEIVSAHFPEASGGFGTAIIGDGQQLVA